MDRRTKIVCTLGPSVATESQIVKLIEAGMNVARFNCSHGDWDRRRQYISWIQAHQPEVAPIGIIADLQGPKFRIGAVPDGRMELAVDSELTVGRTSDCTITIEDDEIWKAMQPGDRLLLGDGDVELRLGDEREGVFRCEVVAGGLVRSRQGVTLVGKVFDVPALTEKDKEDVRLAVEAGVDYIALSYVRRAADIRELRRLIDKYDESVRIVAKIETRAALDEIDEIIKVSDVVMVARGDLGLQMDLEDVPMAQKKIIAKCNASAIPVITATQMLESMMRTARPTRAEASDVANAILDGTDALMLSGETATGDYPFEAVKTMARIACKTETMVDSRAHLNREKSKEIMDTETDSVARAAVEIAEQVGAKAILTSSTSGTTPRLVSRYRPSVPILCACWKERRQRQLSVVWGVVAALVDLPKSTDEAIDLAVRAFVNLHKLKVGDKVVVTTGVPAGQPGNTNLLLVLDV